MADITAWCTLCGARFTHDELEKHGEPSCPKCGYDGYPCTPAQDVKVILNWHELRILTIWAMNYAHDTGKVDLRRTVTAICKRLEKQYPDMAPLTMAGELKGLKDLPGIENVKVEGIQDFDEFVEVYGPGAVINNE